MEEEKLGIENIEKTIEFVEDIAKQVIKALEDKKLSPLEIGALAFKLIKGIGMIKTVKLAVEESRDIDLDEAQALLTKLLEVIGLLADGAEKTEE